MNGVALSVSGVCKGVWHRCAQVSQEPGGDHRAGLQCRLTKADLLVRSIAANRRSLPSAMIREIIGLPSPIGSVLNWRLGLLWPVISRSRLMRALQAAIKRCAEQASGNSLCRHEAPMMHHLKLGTNTWTGVGPPRCPPRPENDRSPPLYRTHFLAKRFALAGGPKAINLTDTNPAS